MLLLKKAAGHKQVVRMLRNTVSQGRVAHAYLFAGPEGVGKETVALSFARALLCSSSADGDACGVCRSCRQVRSGNHPDFYALGPDGASIKIEQIRDIQRKVPYRSYQGGRKIFLIRQAETMTGQASNCLLKTLEEPPPDTVFILITARPQLLPPTILSRCQQVFFKNIPLPELVEGLVRLHGMAEEDALLPAALSGGSMGKALAYTSGSYQEKRQAVYKLLQALSEAGPCEALEMAEKAAESRESAYFTLEILSCWYRDLMVYRETGEAGLLFNHDHTALIKSESERFETPALLEIIESIESAKGKAETNINTRLILEALFLKLAGFAYNYKKLPGTLNYT
ncbi:DNA polymerase III subunit delta' [Pelotomaculum propionicicum]|uniref:DNA polymerase III subunit delta' n=1 Tax=Pelotomaculum propionicicum TaxID=258475 RepID=A0A4Y7RVC6_9FIRM|nr:DNA polymerase III subunit delta' [Pelotomaculum propionicicum]NLI12575.1 DNA polymerase III subunit delta' [Peptococcaceae bacterium]TEB12217.1 DNA polymerase III subunit tau [Pelotomaculum propionicicum]